VGSAVAEAFEDLGDIGAFADHFADCLAHPEQSAQVGVEWFLGGGLGSRGGGGRSLGLCLDGKRTPASGGNGCVQVIGEGRERHRRHHDRD
jgi:hypothetical protein